MKQSTLKEGQSNHFSLNRLYMLKYCHAGTVFDAQLASAEETLTNERERCREEAEQHAKTRAQAAKLQVCPSKLTPWLAQASVCQAEDCLRTTVAQDWVPWYQDALVWHTSHKPSIGLQ